MGQRPLFAWQICPNALLLRGVQGMALWPFVLARATPLAEGSLLPKGYRMISRRKLRWMVEERLLRHERIHLRQQAELLVIPFYLFYGAEYLIRRLRKPHAEAYRAISFEREAYAHESDVRYLSERRFCAFIQYLV